MPTVYLPSTLEDAVISALQAFVKRQNAAQIRDLAEAYNKMGGADGALILVKLREALK